MVARGEEEGGEHGHGDFMPARLRHLKKAADGALRRQQRRCGARRRGQSTAEHLPQLQRNGGCRWDVRDTGSRGECGGRGCRDGRRRRVGAAGGLTLKPRDEVDAGLQGAAAHERCCTRLAHVVGEQPVKQVEHERGEGPGVRHGAPDALVQGLHQQVRRPRHLSADALYDPQLIQLQCCLPQLCKHRQRQTHAWRRRRHKHQRHRVGAVERLWQCAVEGTDRKLRRRPDCYLAERVPGKYHTGRSCRCRAAHSCAAASRGRVSHAGVAEGATVAGGVRRGGE